VGKSTLLNTLVGEEIAWVQDKPGTTLDYITAETTYRNTNIRLYDTAGIRKKGKIVGLEKIAYSKTLKMVEWVHPIVTVLVDIDEGLTHRDKSLMGELITKGVGLVVAVNKIDLYEPDIADQRIAQIRHGIPGGDWIPLVKISGQDGL
jgi:GTP-binding protein